MIVTYTRQQPELMGIFGFSWQEKVARFMYSRLKGTDVAKKMKSFWSGSGMNVTIVNNLYREYAAFMAQGYAPAQYTVTPDAAGDGGTLSQESIKLASLLYNKTGVAIEIIVEFFRALFVLARDGKIPFEKWNPAGYKLSDQLRQTFTTERSKVSTLTSYLKGVSFLAALGLGAYIVSKVR